MDITRLLPWMSTVSQVSCVACDTWLPTSSHLSLQSLPQAFPQPISGYGLSTAPPSQQPLHRGLTEERSNSKAGWRDYSMHEGQFKRSKGKPVSSEHMCW